MKIISKAFLSLLLLLFIACNDKVDPDVSTSYLNSGDWKTARKEALPRLLELYKNSNKDKLYYEVVAKGELILNFYPSGKLLTICSDPGSGWGQQYKGVDGSYLEMLIANSITFDTLANYFSSAGPHPILVLVPGNEFKEPRTNGSPNID